jgi:hypothetical protein
MSCINTATNRPPVSSRGRLDNRGSAILLVVSVAAFVTLLVFTWVVFSVKRYHASIEKRDELRARYAAESVISQVIYEKMVNPNDSMKHPDSAFVNDSADSAIADDPLTYTDSLHGSSATATAEEEGSYFRVRAQGRAGNNGCAIDALFGIELPPQYRFALILAGAGSDPLPLQIRRGRIVGDVQLPREPNGPITGKYEKGAGKPEVDFGKFTREIETYKRKMQTGDSGETVLTTTQTYSGKAPPLSKDKDLFVNGNILIESRSQTPH